MSETFPAAIVFKEKHGRRYFHVTSEDDLYRVATRVLIERINSGDWYFDGDETAAITASTHGPKAWRFLTRRSRDGCEYEGCSVEQYEEFE